MLAWAIVLWQRGQASAGDVVLVCTLGFTVLHATRDLAVALVDVTQHMARLAEAIATLLQPHELRDHPEAAPLAAAGRVTTSLREGRRSPIPAAAGCSRTSACDIEAGQRTGLVGPSGGGKSTVLALLQRFHDVDARPHPDRRPGHRAHHPGEPAPRHRLRAAGHLAAAPLDPGEHPLRPARGVATPRSRRRPKRRAAAISSRRCPSGFDTIVGDRGARLSGGQRQRIAIARALLKDSPILLLDEATSSLDSESEEAIRQALDRLMQGRTVIAIAHRLSTLRSFDRIVRPRATGASLQDGPPDELMRRRGPYRALVESEVARLRQAA